MNIVCLIKGHKFSCKKTPDFIINKKRVEINICSRCHKPFLRIVK